MSSIPCFLTIRQGVIRDGEFSTISTFVFLCETTSVVWGEPCTLTRIDGGEHPDAHRERRITLFGRSGELKGTVPLLLDIRLRGIPSSRRDHAAQDVCHAACAVELASPDRSLPLLGTPAPYEPLLVLIAPDAARCR